MSNNLKLLDGQGLEKAVQEAQKKVTDAYHGRVTKRKYTPSSHETQMQQLDNNRELRLRARTKALPFIDPNLFSDFKLVQGLYLVCGQPGSGKTTTLANMLLTFVNTNPPKKAFVITNEEMPDALLARVACLMMGLNFNWYHQGRYSGQREKEVDAVANDLLRTIHVVSDPAYDMSCLEDVQSVLEFARETGEVAMVLLDYYQTVTYSKDDSVEQVQVLKKLGFYLKEYGRSVDVPVVAFAQLRPKSESQDIESRVQNDRTVYNHAHGVIEVSPDYDAGTTTFNVHKNRFGEKQKDEILMRFDRGRYVAMGSDTI